MKECKIVVRCLLWFALLCAGLDWIWGRVFFLMYADSRNVWHFLLGYCGITVAVLGLLCIFRRTRAFLIQQPGVHTISIMLLLVSARMILHMTSVVHSRELVQLTETASAIVAIGTNEGCLHCHTVEGAENTGDVENVFAGSVSMGMSGMPSLFADSVIDVTTVRHIVATFCLTAMMMIELIRRSFGTSEGEITGGLESRACQGRQDE